MNMVKFVEYKHASTVKLPKKTVVNEYFTLSPEENFLHQFYIKNAQNIFMEIGEQKGREKSKKTMEAHTRILRVMQICSAPYLITPASKLNSSPEDMVNVYSECVFPTDNKINEWIKFRNGPAGLHSSKMKAFVNLVNSIHNNSLAKNCKTVVFANYASTIRLAVDSLFSNEPRYKNKTVSVTGKVTSSKVRDELFSQFRLDPNTTLLFMTLKLGSVGLNLTEACNVIFLEPWYSYAALSQAEARVHRIGQVLPVNIYYLIAKDSVEERVLFIANEKRKLADDIASEKDYKLGLDNMEIILFNHKDE
jgi:SNF2 family DNA or RNA helicase